MKGGDMSKKDLKVLGAIGATGGAVVIMHGITSKKWETAHTILTLLSAFVAVMSVAQ
jgi:ABC-type phosphate/phosphonate transport system permease subunit